MCSDQSELKHAQGFLGGRGECVGGGERVLEGGESVLGEGRVLEEGRECWERGECVGGVLGEGECVSNVPLILGYGEY